MKTILITGANGQLACCIESISANYPQYNFLYKNSKELDITEPEAIKDVFINHPKIDYCINCAAYTAVDKAESEIEQATKVNDEGVRYLSEACKSNEVTLIHVSTDFVFDGNSTKPYKETDPTNPIGVYGLSKLGGEKAITETLERYFIIRTSWLYSEYGSNFMKTMLRLTADRDEISVVDDQVGSPTYAGDLANVILKIIEQDNTSYGLYHYSNEGSISWYDFAKEIFTIKGAKIKLNPIETTEYPTPARRPKYSVMDISKIKRTLGIEIPNWIDSLNLAISNLK